MTRVQKEFAAEHRCGDRKTESRAEAKLRW